MQSEVCLRALYNCIFFSRTFYLLFFMIIFTFIPSNFRFSFSPRSSSLLFHQTFYPLFLPIIFTFIPSNFISYFSPDHLHFYPIKLSIIFFSRSYSLLSHQTFYFHIQITKRTTSVPEPQNQSVSVVFQL